MQTQKSVESFGWQWSEQKVVETRRTLYRRLFFDIKIWGNYLDGKIVADVGSGTGRHAWGISQLTNASKIISVELAEAAVEVQRKLFANVSNVNVISGDAQFAVFKADFIYMLGFIQHTKNPQLVLERQLQNLNTEGEIAVSFYMKTISTMILEPVCKVTRILPKKILWLISPILAFPFIVRKAGRENGWKNARHTAYDWFGSHSYQRYFTETEIMQIFTDIGIHPGNVLKLGKGLYRIKKGDYNCDISDEPKYFGRVDD